jgi:hypothetical protein
LLAISTSLMRLTAPRAVTPPGSSNTSKYQAGEAPACFQASGEVGIDKNRSKVSGNAGGRDLVATASAPRQAHTGVEILTLQHPAGTKRRTKNGTKTLTTFFTV